MSAIANEKNKMNPFANLLLLLRPVKDDENSYNSYLQIAERLVPYVKEMGFTHVELMPIMVHRICNNLVVMIALSFQRTKLGV